jgi:hypothetical protein
MMKRACRWSLLFLPGIAAGCRIPGTSAFAFGGDQVKGSGVSKTETRNVGRFTAIHVDGSFEVRVTAGRAQQVVLTADDNLLPILVTETSDGTLRLTSSKGYSAKTPVRVEISVPNLRKVDIAGSCAMKVTGINESAFVVDISGSGKLEVAGRARSLGVDISGSGRVEAGNLEAREAEIDISGSGTIDTNVSDTLKSAISGSGRVTYRGRPRNVKSDITGSGRVTPR